MNVAIVSDSHSGVTKHDTTGTNIFILHIPISLNGEIKEDFETISFSKFDKMIYNNYKIESTTPSAKSIKEMWNYLLKIKQYDYIIHIPYSSNLGDMYELCQMLSNSYDGKVFVVDNKRLGVSLKPTLFNAKKMANNGYTPSEITKILNSIRNDFSMYMMIDNPKFVKKNCKLKLTEKAISGLSSPKPVFELVNGVLELKKKCRSKKAACKNIIKALDKDLKTKFKEYVDKGEMELFIAYSGEIEESVIIKEHLAKKYPTMNIVYTDPFPICLCSNLGLGNIVIGCSRFYRKPKGK